MARLTDPASVRRYLGVGPEAAVQRAEFFVQRAEFFVAYAEMLEANRRRDPGQTSGTRDNVWRRVANPEQEWLGHATLASTYRQAAQHAALVDIRWATDLAVRAGLAYLDAGLPFGAYLLVGLLDDQILRAGSVLETLLAADSATSAAALADPVQQMYLLLAAASRPWLRDALGEETVDGARRRLSAHELLPIGPQSVPLGDYLELATILLDDGPGPTVPASPEIGAIARLLAARGRAQFGSLRLARRNEYLWDRGAAPVNIVDLENVAMYGLAMRHRPYPWFEQLYQAISSELAYDDQLTELSVWATDSIQAVLPSISGHLVEMISQPEPAERREPGFPAGRGGAPTSNWRPEPAPGEAPPQPYYYDDGTEPDGFDPDDPREP